MHTWTIFVWICFLSYASEGNNEPTNRDWKTCNYGKKYIEGTLLATRHLGEQVNYKSCRRRCIEKDGCNYWSFVSKKNSNVALRGTCSLYSTIDTRLTINDSGRFSGDISCSSAETLKAELRPNSVSLYWNANLLWFLFCLKIFNLYLQPDWESYENWAGKSLQLKSR